MSTPRAAIYARISQDQKHDELGIGRQESGCRRLARTLGWDVVDVYADNDISAYSGKRRPEYERLLADIAAGRVDAVLCSHPDRLYRRLLELGRLIDAVEHHHTAIRTVSAGEVDLTTPTGRMNARIVASVAQHEVELKADRQKRANQQHAELGHWRSRKRVFGYEHGGKELVATEADAIRLAVQDILTGTPTAEIARRWNAQGLTTSHGKTWDSGSVTLVLKNPCYSRQVVHQKRILHGVVGQWPEILPYEQHEALKAFFQTRSKPARPRKWQGSGLYLCGRCNDGQTLMSGTQSHGAGPFYRCPVGLHLGRKATDLDFYVNELVVHRLSRPDAWDLVRKQHQLDVKALRAEREGLEARRNQLARMFATGEIEHAQLKAGTDILTPQIDALDAQINAAGLRSPLTGILDSGDVRNAYAELSADRRAVIIDALMTVTVLPCPRGRRKFAPEFIDIAWK